MILRMVGGPYDGSDIRSTDAKPPLGYTFASAPMRWVRDRFSTSFGEGPLQQLDHLPPRQEYRLIAVVERALVQGEDVALYAYANETPRTSGFAPPFGADVLRCYLSEQQRQAIAYRSSTTEEAVARVLRGMAALGLDVIRIRGTALDR
jgi:hypothetical protein